MKIKPTQESIDQVINQLSYMKDKKRRIERLSKCKDLDALTVLKEILLDHISMCDRNVTAHVNAKYLDGLERIKEIDLSDREKDAYLYIISLIDKPDETQKKVEDHIGRLEAELEAKRNELKEWGEVESPT